MRGCWNYGYLHKGSVIVFGITLLIADLRIPELILLDTQNYSFSGREAYAGMINDFVVDDIMFFEGVSRNPAIDLRLRPFFRSQHVPSPSFLPF